MASSRLASFMGRTLITGLAPVRGGVRYLGLLNTNTPKNIFTHNASNVRVMSSSVINLSDFEATEKFTQLNHKSVLYFTATWCPPCKVIKPVYEELSSKYANVAFGKIDVDDNSDAALEFNITSVPTFVFFDGENIMERFSGADPGMLEKLLQDLEGK